MVFLRYPANSSLAARPKSPILTSMFSLIMMFPSLRLRECGSTLGG